MPAMLLSSACAVADMHRTRVANHARWFFLVMLSSAVYSEFQPVIFAQQSGEIFRLQGLAEVETLDGIAAVAAQELALGAGLHALRHHRDLEVMGHADDGDRDGRIVRIQADVAHEGLVYLYLVQMEAPEIAQAR